MREYKKESGIIGAVVVFFLLLFVFTKFVGPIPFSVNNIVTQNNTPFEAQGVGKASAAPDEVIINIGIKEEAPTALTAQGEVNKTAELLIEELKKIGVEEKNIKTINYSVNPSYDFSDGKQTIRGYTVAQNFEVKAPIDKANSIIDVSTKTGANVVGNLRFDLNEEKKEELKNEARKEAIQKAKKSAEGLADAADIKLGKIINVKENFGINPPRPVTLEARGDVVIEELTPTNITPGESNIEVVVILTYETF